MQTIHHKPDGNPAVEAQGEREQIAPEAVRQQLERVLADPLFQSSRRITALLAFLVQATLRGQQDALKERTIGIEVFGRVPDFDTGNDSSVRVAASQLRKRLGQYYAEPQHSSELHIYVPVGSYAAEWKWPATVRPAEQLPALVDSSTKQAITADGAVRRPAARRIYIWAAVAAIVLTVATLSLMRGLAAARNSVDRFWLPALTATSPAVICIGSPVEANWTPEDPPSAPGSNDNKSPFYVFEQRVNVGMMDMKAADELTVYLHEKHVDSTLRPTLGSRLADLRSSPMVVYGMFLNDWATQLGPDLHFRFRKQSVLGLRWIEEEAHPDNRSWSNDLSAPYEDVHADYALITRVRDQTTRRWWIGIAGLTSVGTLAANRLMLDPRSFSTVVSKLPWDWDRKNLQIVLKIKLVDGNPGVTQVVGTASW